MRSKFKRKKEMAIRLRVHPLWRTFRVNPRSKRVFDIGNGKSFVMRFDMADLDK